MTDPDPGGFGILASQIQPERVVWLSQGRLAAGMLTVLDGDPGVGKSTLSREWAARITRGLPLPNGPARPPRGVVLCSAEDAKSYTIRPSLELLGADLDRVLVESLKDPTDGVERLMGIPSDLDTLKEAIVRMDAALVIIDPVMAYIDHEFSTNNDQQVRRALSPLAQLAEQTNCAMLLLRHMRKAEAVNVLYRGGGSIGIIGLARFGLVAAPHPDDATARLVAPTKCNIGPMPSTLHFGLETVPGLDVPRLHWKEESHLSAQSLIDAQETDAETRSEVNDWLRDLLTAWDKGMAAHDVFKQGKQLGYSERTLQRAAKAIGVVKHKTGGTGAPWLWTLKGVKDDKDDAFQTRPGVSPLNGHEPDGAQMVFDTRGEVKE